MLAANLSDTVGFKSPTSPARTKKLLSGSQTRSIDDLAAFTLEIFKAKSDVTKLSAIDIVKNDYKVFDFAKQKVMIDQLETVEPAKVLTDKKAELLKAMQEVKSELQADLIFVAITDILQVNTKLLILDQKEAEIACKAFGGTVKDQILDIGARLSAQKRNCSTIEKALS
jgi:manganese-dependent inorganic pyrophosphatase